MSLELVVGFVDAIANLLRRISITIKSSGSLTLEFKPETLSLDERIKKIEEAKNALKQALTAVDDLQSQAVKNKSDAEKALVDLIALEQDKAKLNDQIKADTQLINNDIERFKKLAGIPSEKERRTDKIIGFISGVLASVLASIIVALSVFIYTNYFDKDKTAKANPIIEHRVPPPSSAAHVQNNSH